MRMFSFSAIFTTAAVAASFAVGGCCGSSSETAKPIAEVPESHKPVDIMGRDCWRVLSKYSVYGWNGKSTGFDNPELNASRALSDTAPGYVAAANPPPASTGYAVWPRLEDYFRPGAPDREILVTNPCPDRPFFLGKRSERRRTTWGSPVSVDMKAYAEWRAAHPNLVVDGNISEWCNDLNNAWTTLQGKETMYARNLPDSKERFENLKKFMGERPKTRYEQLELMRRYYGMRKERNFGGKMSVLDAHLNSLHIAADFGASLLRIETTASGQYRYQPSSMFTRGAARQFGLPWEWYIAGYVNGYAVNGEYLGDTMCRYPSSAKAKPPYKHYSKNVVKAKYWPGGQIRIGNGGPEFGISRSLFKRTHYYAYLSGANFIQLEEWMSVLRMWDMEKGKTVFSPRGEIYSGFAEFMHRHPDRGAHYSPVAVCVPLAQGYPTWGGAPFANGKFGYTNGDKAVDAVFFTLVPGTDYNERSKKGEEMCMRNSAYADMYDVITPDAETMTPERLLGVMKCYKALVVAGDYADKGWEKTLARYQAEGGKVIRVDERMLAGEVKSGKGRGINRGETRYPKLEAALKKLQDEFFPFAVTGDCAYGMTVAESHSWLYVFNHDGVIKFADAPQKTDVSKTSDITVSLRPGNGRIGKVTELLDGKEVAVTEGTSFRHTLGPGEFAIFEIRR